MSTNQLYPLGKAISSIQLVLSTSLRMKKKDNPDAWKVDYSLIMENLIEIFELLESTELSKSTLMGVFDELEGLDAIYGELTYDRNLPSGQRVIGGIKQ